MERLPFRIGRHGDNELVLRDGRASRHHAQLMVEDGRYVIEDLESSYGVFVNGKRVKRQPLDDADQIDFGFADSYHLVFKLSEPSAGAEAPADRAVLAGTNLAKLRATLEVARALQTSLSTDEVLSAVIEAALAVTGCERGFLLLRKGDDLEIRVARSHTGPLAPGDFRVPTHLLMRALKQRQDFLSMNFDPAGAAAGGAERSVADLELRSVVCVPLVHVRAGSVAETTALSPSEDTVGLLYMDSRLRPADLAAGSRELLTTLALEASTVLENARLLEEQWARQHMDEELRIARQIQESLLPRMLPSTGWFRAAATSIPSLQVGGDYMDFRQVNPSCWSTVMADVSGKGVGAAILAALLQGMFLAAPYTRLSIEETMYRVNRYLNERTEGEQYVTLFYAMVEQKGLVRWVNAGHLPPLVVRACGRLETLPAGGLPIGMFHETTYPAAETQLEPRDQIVLYTDGVTEARNGAGEFFGLKRLREEALQHAGAGCQELHAVLLGSLQQFTGGAPQNDDVSLGVMEYRRD